MTTNNGVNSPLSGTTGTGNFVGSTSPSVTTPKIVTSVNDSNGNSALGVTATASAVNYVQLANAASGNNPSFAATGAGTNLALVLNGKGTGGVATQGSTGGASVAAGYVGEYFISQVAAGSAVAATRNVATDITSLSLTAGNWLIFGNVGASNTTATTQGVQGWTSTTSATAPDPSQKMIIQTNAIANGTGGPVPLGHVNFGSTTTVYLSGIFVDTASNGNLFGILQAVRTA